MKRLLIVTSLIETATGLGLIGGPAMLWGILASTQIIVALRAASMVRHPPRRTPLQRARAEGPFFMDMRLY